MLGFSDQVDNKANLDDKTWFNYVSEKNQAELITKNVGGKYFLIFSISLRTITS